MNYSKLTKAQLIEMIEGLKDELVHVSQQKTVVADETALPWNDSSLSVSAAMKAKAEQMGTALVDVKLAQASDADMLGIPQVQASTTTHAEIMRVRLAAAKAQAMATGKAVKA